MFKNTKIEWIEPNVINCLKSGISIHLFYMIGFPTETKEEALNTYKFAEDMISRSQRIFNNHYSSHGFGTFGLEKYSYIWNNPSEFNIIVNDENDKDLSLGYDYEAFEGLTSKEAEELVSQLNGSTMVELDKYKIMNFFDHQKLSHSEEQNFINNVNKNQYNETNTIKVRHTIKNLDKKIILRLDSDCEYLHLEYNITRKDFNYFDNIIIFNYRCNTIFILGKRFEALFHKLIHSISIGEISSEYIDLIDDLLFYNIITLDQKNIDNHDPVNISECDLIFNQNTKEFIDNNLIQLFNENNGKALKVSEFSYKLLKYLSTPLQYCKIFEQLGVSKDNKAVNNLINLALSADILYVQFPFDIE